MCEHRWTPVSDILILNLTNCKGEVGPIDMFPIFHEVEGNLGTVCYLCYQLYGELPGVLLAELVMFEQKMSDLQTAYQQHS